MTERQRNWRLSAWGLAAALAAGGFAAAALPALAQGVAYTGVGAQVPDNWPGRVGRMAGIQGTVWFYDRDEGAWIQAQPNRPLTSGDRISTDRGSHAVLRIGSTALRVAGDTDLVLDRIDDRSISVNLTEGSVALRITAADVLAQVEIRTAEGRFVPRSVGHFRIDRRTDSSEGTAWRGQMMFDGSDSQLAIAAGQHAEFWLQDNPPATHYRLLPAERDEFAGWAASDDRDPDRNLTARYVSPEMTGWEELDRYGRWSANPEFGNVWIPSNVPVGWAPYQNGNWVWVSPWGWTWVDAAPWGFAPFHYGRWVRWNNRWCWTPGPRNTRPHYAPALVSWTPAPHRDADRRPPPPSHWSPLNPREVYRPIIVQPFLPRDRDRVPPPPPRVDRPTPRVDHQPAPRVERQPVPFVGRQPEPRIERPVERPTERPIERPIERPRTRPEERQTERPNESREERRTNPRDDRRAAPAPTAPVAPPAGQPVRPAPAPQVTPPTPDRPQAQPHPQPQPFARPALPQPVQPPVPQPVQPPVPRAAPPAAHLPSPAPVQPVVVPPPARAVPVPRTEVPSREQGRPQGAPEGEGRKRAPEQPSPQRDRSGERPAER